jgi:hypothetical protein
MRASALATSTMKMNIVDSLDLEKVLAKLVDYRTVTPQRVATLNFMTPLKIT